MTTPDVRAPVRVLVVDDDRLARAFVRTFVQAQSQLRFAGECGDGEEAAAVILADRPDLVVLDVQMPRLDGFGLVARVGLKDMPPVIFASAYAEFAVRAFEAYAIDYVLKPFDEDRLAAALARGSEAVTERRGRARRGEHAPDDRLDALLAQLARLDVGGRPGLPTGYPDALAVKVGDRYAVVRVADVDWIGADGNYAVLHVQDKTRVIARTLATLEREVLDPAQFVRVHRSAIVNVRRVVSVEPTSHGDLTLVLHGGGYVDCSRRFRDRLEARLYFTT